MKFSQLFPFGTEVSEFDIRFAANEDIQALKLTLARSGVAVIRNQWVDDLAFVTFLKQLGPLTFTQGETPVAEQPLLNIVTNVGRKRSPRSVFHTDTSYISQPPAYTALKAVALPQSGGETLFCNQYRAYESLPNSVRQQLSRAEVLHVMTGLTLSDQEEQQAWHPLFNRHPISDQIALFLSTPERCQVLRILDSSDCFPASQRVLSLLYRHSIRPHRLYRHRWQLGDIVVWDNRCTMHRADHSKVAGDRTLHRGLIGCPH